MKQRRRELWGMKFSEVKALVPRDVARQGGFFNMKHYVDHILANEFGSADNMQVSDSTESEGVNDITARLHQLQTVENTKEVVSHFVANEAVHREFHPDENPNANPNGEVPTDESGILAGLVCGFAPPTLPIVSHHGVQVDLLECHDAGYRQRIQAAAPWIFENIDSSKTIYADDAMTYFLYFSTRYQRWQLSPSMVVSPYSVQGIPTPNNASKGYVSCYSETNVGHPEEARSWRSDHAKHHDRRTPNPNAPDLVNGIPVVYARQLA